MFKDQHTAWTEDSDIQLKNSKVGLAQEIQESIKTSRTKFF